MKRAEIWTVAGGSDYAGKPRPAVIIQDDVFSRLLTFPNVVITAHQAFFTQNALDAIAAQTVRNLVHFDRGEPLEAVVRG